MPDVHVRIIALVPVSVLVLVRVVFMQSGYPSFVT